MSRIYKQSMIDILRTLSIDLPDTLRMDQVQIEALIAKIDDALDTYDPLPTGDAVAADVLAGKTFSNATGTGLMGTLVYTAMPTPVATLMPMESKVLVERAPMYEGYFVKIAVVDADGEEIGVAEVTEQGAYYYDLTDIVATGANATIGLQYIPKDTVTLSESDVAEVAIDMVSVTRALTGCEDSNTAGYALMGGKLTGTLSVIEGFSTLPATIDVTIGGTAAVLDTDYTYDPVTGAYGTKVAITGDIVITAVAV